MGRSLGAALILALWAGPVASQTCPPGSVMCRFADPGAVLPSGCDLDDETGEIACDDTVPWGPGGSAMIESMIPPPYPTSPDTSDMASEAPGASGYSSDGASAGGAGQSGADGGPGGSDTAAAAPEASSDTGRVAATRLFAAPRDVPPADFAAYAVLAAWEDPAGADRVRYAAICRGFLAILDSAHEPGLPPRRRQLVTIWPVDTTEAARDLNGDPGASDADRCDRAVRRYHRPTGRAAIRDAETASAGLRGQISTRRGPFLLAWNPGAAMGDPDVPLFRMDLSGVQTERQAAAFFRLWRRGVIERRENWVDGWQDPTVRMRLNTFFESNADAIVTALGEVGALVRVLGDGS